MCFELGIEIHDGPLEFKTIIVNIEFPFLSRIFFSCVLKIKLYPIVTTVRQVFGNSIQVQRHIISRLQVCQAVYWADGKIAHLADREVQNVSLKPSPFEAARYHSLAVRAPLPSCLLATAWTADGTLMGLRHRDLPLEGVQFHPESFLTPQGTAVLRNFVAGAPAHA